MNWAALQGSFFNGIRSNELGLSPLPDLNLYELLEGTEHFLNLVWKDSELVSQGISDFESLDTFLNRCAESRTPTALSQTTREALVVLAHLFMQHHAKFAQKDPEWIEISDSMSMIEFSDSMSREEMKSKLAAVRRHENLSKKVEGCILNAAYSCPFPNVLIAAGRYYLEVNFSVDPRASVAYFIRATEIDSSSIGCCDALLKNFVKKHGMEFALSETHLQECIDAWKKHKEARA